MTKRRVYQVVLETPEEIRAIECGADEHIWDAAARQSILLPAICHQGRCLTCAGRLVNDRSGGSVKHDHPDSYFAEDEAAGFVLLCRAMPRSEVRIRTHQEWKMREHRLALGLPAPYA